MDPWNTLIIGIIALVAIAVWARRHPAPAAPAGAVPPIIDPAGNNRAMRESFGAPEPAHAAGSSRVRGGNLAYDTAGRLVGWARYEPGPERHSGPQAVAIAGAAGGAGGPGAPPAAGVLGLTLNPNTQALGRVAGGGTAYGLVATGLPTGTPVTIDVTGLTPAGVTWDLIGLGTSRVIEAGRSYGLRLTVTAAAFAAAQTINFRVTGVAGAASAAVNGTLQIT